MEEASTSNNADKPFPGWTQEHRAKGWMGLPDLIRDQGKQAKIAPGFMGIDLGGEKEKQQHFRGFFLVLKALF